MSLLEIDNLCFSYGEHDILRDVGFSADENTMISVLGPNGVGKTTLMKCICRINIPQKGKIRIDGDDVLSLSPRDFARKVAYVPQSASRVKTTVFDSVLIGRRPYMGWSMSDDDMELAWQTLKTMGLENIALKNTDEISGGEFQKVQIARALVQDPRLLILDEPTSNLDIANQHHTMKMIATAVKERGLCTLMTMHDINLASCYSDIFVFVKNGRIHSWGGKEIITSETIREVYGLDVDVIEHRGHRMILPGEDADEQR